MDEGVSAMIARLPWPDFLTLTVMREGNMSLYYLLLRAWSVFGSSEFHLRSLSVLFGGLTVLFVYFLGKELYGRSAGLVAALVLALHPFHVHFSQEARSYALLGFTLVLAAYFLVRALRTGSELHCLAFTVASALSVYAHFFAILPIAALLAAAIVFPEHRITAKQARNALALLGLLILPSMVYAWNHRNIGLIDWIPSPSWELLGRCAAALLGADGFLAAAYAMVFAAMIALGRKHNRLGALPLSWALLPGMVLLLASFHKPVLVNRYLLMSVPGMALLLAYQAERLSKRWQIAFVSALVLLSALSLERSFKQQASVSEDWRGAIRYAIAHAQPNDVVLLDNGIARPVFEYYRQQFNAAAPRVNSFGPRSEELNYADFAGITRPAVVGRVAKLRERVWILEWGAGNPLIPEMERYFQEADARAYPGVKVRLYVRRAAAPEP